MTIFDPLQAYWFPTQKLSLVVFVAWVIYQSSLPQTESDTNEKDVWKYLPWVRPKNFKLFTVQLYPMSKYKNQYLEYF